MTNKKRNEKNWKIDTEIYWSVNSSLNKRMNLASARKRMKYFFIIVYNKEYQVSFLDDKNNAVSIFQSRYMPHNKVEGKDVGCSKRVG